MFLSLHDESCDSAACKNIQKQQNKTTTAASEGGYFKHKDAVTDNMDGACRSQTQGDSGGSDPDRSGGLLWWCEWRHRDGGDTAGWMERHTHEGTRRRLRVISTLVKSLRGSPPPPCWRRPSGAQLQPWAGAWAGGWARWGLLGSLGPRWPWAAQ